MLIRKLGRCTELHCENATHVDVIDSVTHCIKKSIVMITWPRRNSENGCWHQYDAKSDFDFEPPPAKAAIYLQQDTMNAESKTLENKTMKSDLQTPQQAQCFRYAIGHRQWALDLYSLCERAQSNKMVVTCCALCASTRPVPVIQNMDNILPSIEKYWTSFWSPMMSR